MRIKMLIAWIKSKAGDGTHIGNFGDEIKQKEKIYGRYIGCIGDLFEDAMLYGSFSLITDFNVRVIALAIEEYRHKAIIEDVDTGLTEIIKLDEKDKGDNEHD